MINKYKINGTTDLFTIAGFLPDKDAYKTFLQERTPKEPYSYDWPERNGKQYDLTSSIKFNDRVFKLKGYIKASSKADYQTKLAALKTAIYPTGRTYTITSVVANVTVTVFTKAITPEPVGRFSGTLVFVQVELELQEVQA